VTAIRVTEQWRVTQQTGYLNSVSERLDKIQQQMSTGRRIARASDDPAGASLALHYRDSLDFETQMRRNMDNGTSFMNVTEAALNSATDALQRVRELTVQAANDTLAQQDRQAIAKEVDQLIQHLAQIGNSTFGDAYIFSGHLTKTPAFLVTGNPPTAITFQGDTGQRLHRISRQDTVAVNVDGQTAFGTMFTDLITLRDNLIAGGPAATISASLSDIDKALDKVLQARADVGAKLNRLEASKATSVQADINLQELRSGIEEVDLPTAIVQLQSQQNALQAALGAIGRTSNMSLIDFMR
jgi:flagellar hook-associated protein 3 FlgL